MRFMPILLAISFILLPIPSSSTALISSDFGSLKFIVNIFTHMLDHGNLGHLLGNFMFMAPFGIYLERRIGLRNLCSLYFLCGLGAVAGFAVSAAHTAVWGVIGSSGAAFGMFAAACFIYGSESKGKEATYKRLLGAGWMSVALLIQTYLGIYSIANVAYFAHIGGAITAIFLLHVVGIKGLLLPPSKQPGK